jgi:hypothetical protein
MIATERTDMKVDADLRAASSECRTPQPRPEVAAHLRGVAFILSWMLAGQAAAADWIPVPWHDESAYEIKTADWRAIVSVDRGRLVHFGPVDSDTSFVYAAEARNSPAGWGGHRVWLGPQNAWSPFWPPPAAWERSAAETTTPDGARLTLVMPAAGDGWPRLTRVYEIVEDGQLACRVRLSGDGTRDAQIMQIVQTRPSENLTVPIAATAEAPLGCMLLPPFRGRREIMPLTKPLDYMSIEDGGLRIHHPAPLDKIAFAPQALVPRYAGGVLHLARGRSVGAEAGAPDRGYYTQVCPGQDGTPAIELEQMSPLYRAGEAAEFTVLLGLTRD